jgi:hypothetical protein
MNLNKYILKPYNYSSYKLRGWFGRKLYLLSRNLKTNNLSKH